MTNKRDKVARTIFKATSRKQISAYSKTKLLNLVMTLINDSLCLEDALLSEIGHTAINPMSGTVQCELEISPSCSDTSSVKLIDERGRSSWYCCDYCARTKLLAHSKCTIIPLTLPD